jgi:pantoate--beta-alanine ligase
LNVARTLPELRKHRDDLDGEVGLVPTMGALHDGHIALVRAARESCDTVVVSIFVNPTQFGPTEDFESYPRDERADLELCAREGVDLVFTPSVGDMYPDGAATSVHAGELATIVEGESRPGHFDGVCTVVARLFNLISPQVAFFGQKDAQQVAVVRRMTTDLGFRVEVVAVPTARERDGLALSSRNIYLSEQQRALAPSLNRAMTAASAAAPDDPRLAEEVMRSHLAQAGVTEVDYALAVRPDNFRPAQTGESALLVVAARFGSTRLIDNLFLGDRA